MTIHATPGVLDAVGRALASESARFAGRGWMPGTAGNLSIVLAREPLQLAVTASGLDKGELGRADVVVVDEHGELVEPHPTLVPSAEAGLHARIAAVTGAGAVIHTHTPVAVAAGHRWPEGVRLTGLEMLKGLGHAAHDEVVTVPVVPNGQDMRLVGDAFVAQRDPAGPPALILADHGYYAWGRDLTQARHHAELLDGLLTIALSR